MPENSSFLEEMCILTHSWVETDNDLRLPIPLRKGFLISGVQ